MVLTSDRATLVRRSAIRVALRLAVLLPALWTATASAQSSPAPGTLFGLEYTLTGETRLVEIDPATGAHVLRFEGLPWLDDIDCDPLSGRLIGPSLVAGEVIALDPATGLVESIGPPGALLTSLAVHPITHVIYAVDIGSTLYTVDRDTGFATPIGPTGVVEIVSIAFDPVTADLYGVTAVLPSLSGTIISELVTIDESSGVASGIGASPVPLTGIAVDPAATIFACDTGEVLMPPVIADASLHVLDPTTAGVSESIATSIEALRGIAFWRTLGMGFRRGDTNGDGVADVSDVVFALAALFIPGAPQPTCSDAADVNDDGLVDVSDAVFALASLFVPGSPPVPEPSPACGIDPTPSDPLDCALGCP